MTPAAATYIEQLGEMLRTLYGHCRPGVARAVVDSIRGEHVPSANPIPQVPMWLVDALTAESVVVTLATATTAHSGSPLRDLGALWTDIPVALRRVRSGALEPDPASVDDALGRLAAFPCRAPIVIDAGASLVAVWPLAKPIALSGDGFALAEALQRRLAEALGGRVDDVTVTEARSSQVGGPVPHVTLAACSPLRPAVPVPGSRDRGEMDVFVDFAAGGFDPRRVDIEDVRAALNGGDRAKKKGRTA